MHAITWLDGAGFAGVLLILAAYAGVQLRRLDPIGIAAQLLNLAGAGLILASLTRAFNLAAFTMEAAWAALAAYGLIRRLLRR